MTLDIVTVALLTPVLIAASGDYSFPLVAVAADPASAIYLQGLLVPLDENGHGLGIAALPVEEGRKDYVVTVQHGIIEQELVVTVIGKRPPLFAWWLLAAPLGALLLSVRIQKVN